MQNTLLEPEEIGSMALQSTNIRERHCEFSTDCVSLSGTLTLTDIKLYSRTYNDKGELTWANHGDGFRIILRNSPFTKQAFMTTLVHGLMQGLSPAAAGRYSQLEFGIAARPPDHDDNTIYDVTWVGERHLQCILQHHGFSVENGLGEMLCDKDSIAHVWQVLLFVSGQPTTAYFETEGPLAGHTQTRSRIQSNNVGRAIQRIHGRYRRALRRSARLKEKYHRSRDNSAARPLGCR